MRTFFQIFALVLFAISPPGAAAESKSYSGSAPIACYQKAWGSKDNPGLGLTAGQAIELCGGATDADKVILCYAEAWGHPDEGGLGLTAGQAIALCKARSQSVGGMP